MALWLLFRHPRLESPATRSSPRRILTQAHCAVRLGFFARIVQCGAAHGVVYCYNISTDCMYQYETSVVVSSTTIPFLFFISFVVVNGSLRAVSLCDSLGVAGG